ncbi:MAG: hypothetical protein ABI645_11025 [Pseudomonadota bacterium]
MNEQIVRNCVLTDRLARHLADYYYRRVCGMRCPDLLPPEERAKADSCYDQRLECARLFVRGLQPTMSRGGSGVLALN